MKLTKSDLLKQIDLVLVDLYLLKSTMNSNARPKQQKLVEYEKRFQEVISKK